MCRIAKLRNIIFKPLLRLLILLVLCLPVIAFGSWPHDPEHTLEHVLNEKQMRIGVIQNSPWSNYLLSFSGWEVRIIREFCVSLHVEPRWFSFSEKAGVMALKNHQIDVLIGGFTDDSPWKKELAFTRPYFIAKYYLGIPPGYKYQKGNKVAVSVFSFLVPEIEKSGDLPYFLNNPWQFSGPVAASEWELVQRKYFLYKELTEEKHVLAVPNGENLFLSTLEKFLLKTEKLSPTWFMSNETDL